MAALGGGSPAILPSLLLCDFARLADEVANVQRAGVQGLHLDVMDGHFVPNLTYGPTIVSAVRTCTDLPLDVHLMISNPGDHVEAFRRAGADNITIHIEAQPDPRPILKTIRTLGATAGLALNPATPLSAVEPFLAECDVLLVMSVHPGFGGQAFEPVAIDKLRRLSEVPSAKHLLLEVDGGINGDTIGRCAKAGAGLFVVGSAIFRKPDYQVAVSELTQKASEGARVSLHT